MVDTAFYESSFCLPIFPSQNVLMSSLWPALKLILQCVVCNLRIIVVYTLIIIKLKGHSERPTLVDFWPAYRMRSNSSLKAAF